MTDASAVDDRAIPSRHALELEARWGMRFMHLNARLYEHMRTVLRFITIVAGSSAFAAFLAGRPEIVLIVGVLLALLTAIDVTLAPAERAARFAMAAERYGDLFGRGPELSAESLYRDLRRLQGQRVVGHFECLRHVAYTNVLVETGHSIDDCRAPWRCRVLAWFA